MRLGKNVPLMIMSLTGYHYTLTAASLWCCGKGIDRQKGIVDRDQNYILWESCCLKLKDSFVHHSHLNNMGLTPSRHCLHIWELPIRWRRVKAERTQWRAKLISSMCCGCDRTSSFLSWKALKINDWPKSFLTAIIGITAQPSPQTTKLHT